MIAGPSGAGKSTLLRAIAGLLLTADVGEESGRVLIGGAPPHSSPGQVGLLFQDPTAGLVAGTAGRDVAFGLENTGVPREQMPPRVRRALDAAGFPYDEGRRVDSLSGGETQRLALAGALALEPRVLLLDEPTAMLDREASAQVREAVLESAETSGATLVVVEHRLEGWAPNLDRCIVLDGTGRVVADGPTDRVLGETALESTGVWLPGLPAPRPLAVDPALVAPVTSTPVGEAVVTAEGIRVQLRSRNGGASSDHAALSGVSCAVRAGSGLGIVGASGAGKSTLLATLAGLQRPNKGTCEVHPAWAGRKGRAVTALSSRELARRITWVPQFPEHGLLGRTVAEECLITGRALGLADDQTGRRGDALLEVLGLSARAEVNPHRLSGGEQRRLALAAGLAHGPAALLLDEPTLAQDRLTWSAVTGICRAALIGGTAVAVATHDEPVVDVLTRHDRGEVLHLEHGCVSGTTAA